MKGFEINLKQFREERNLLTYNHEAFIKMVTEELDEVLTANNWNDRVGEMCDVCVLCFNALAQNNEPYRKDGRHYNQYKSIDEATHDTSINISNGNYGYAIDCMRNCITLNGYDFDKAMLETSKKILSREGAMDESTGKWTKLLTQSKETLYTPDYSKCKL